MIQQQQARQKISGLINHGMSYFQNGKYDLTFETMSEVLRLEPNNQIARNYIEMARQAEKEISQDIRAGISFYNQKKYQSSIEKMKDVLRRDPDNQTAKEYLDRCNVKIEEFNHDWISNPQVGPSK